MREELLDDHKDNELLASSLDDKVVEGKVLKLNGFFRKVPNCEEFCNESVRIVALWKCDGMKKFVHNRNVSYYLTVILEYNIT